MKIKNIWFVKKGWIHYPVTVKGWVIFLCGLLFVLNIIFAILLHARSLGDFLYGVFPFAIPTFLLYEWIASHKDK